MTTCIPSFLAWMTTNSGVGTLAQWISAICAVVGLGLAIYSAFWAVRQWGMQHIVEDWGKTVAFLLENAKYLDKTQNAAYKTFYSGEELVKYDLVARRSVAYVDDVFHLGMRGQLNRWLKGAVNLFIAPHKAWFDDQKDVYSVAFVEMVKKEFSPLPANPTVRAGS